MAATRDELIEFFESKKKGIYVCPVCGEHLLNILVAAPVVSNEVTQPPAILAMIIHSGPGAHHFYGLSCANCGFTSLLHAAAFDAWKAAKEEKQKAMPNG